MAAKDKLPLIFGIIVLILCGVVMALCFAAIFVVWTDYDVSESISVSNASDAEQLESLQTTWPQMFFRRQVSLIKVCYPSMDDATWQSLFNKKHGWCGKSTKCYCLSKTEYQTPINSEYQQTDDQRKLNSLYDATLAMICLVLIFNCALYAAPFCLNRSPRVIGTAGFITAMLEEISVIAAIIVYCAAEKLDESTENPPQFGFVQANTYLSSATKRSRSHGFAICCALVAIVTTQLVFYLCSWLPRLCCAKESRPDQLTSICCCCPASDLHQDNVVVGTHHESTVGPSFSTNYAFATEKPNYH